MRARQITETLHNIFKNKYKYNEAVLERQSINERGQPLDLLQAVEKDLFDNVGHPFDTQPIDLQRINAYLKDFFNEHELSTLSDFQKIILEAVLWKLDGNIQANNELLKKYSTRILDISYKIGSANIFPDSNKLLIQSLEREQDGFVKRQNEYRDTLSRKFKSAIVEAKENTLKIVKLIDPVDIRGALDSTSFISKLTGIHNYLENREKESRSPIVSIFVGYSVKDYNARAQAWKEILYLLVSPNEVKINDVLDLLSRKCIEFDKLIGRSNFTKNFLNLRDWIVDNKEKFLVIRKTQKTQENIRLMINKINLNTSSHSKVNRM